MRPACHINAEAQRRRVRRALRLRGDIGFRFPSL